MRSKHAWFVVVLVALLMLSACNVGDTTTTTKATQGTTKQQATASTTSNALAYLNLSSEMPIVNEGYDLTLKIVSVPGAGYTATPKDHWIWAFFEEYCNVKMDVTYYEASSWEEQRNLIFTTGDLPDVFYLCAFNASDMVRYGQVEGLFHPLEDLIKDYAPLIQSAIDEFPSILLETTTPDGHMYAIPSIENPDDYPLNTTRYFIHQSWLDELGLATPQTLNELHTVLTSFKNDDPNGNGQADEIPWVAYNRNAAVIPLTALGINASSTTGLYARKDGKVSMAVAEDNYIYYLEYMKKFMSDSLIDEDYYTMTVEQNNAKLSQNIAGLSQMSAPFVYMPDPEQWGQYQVLSPLTSEYNNERVWPIGSQIRQGTFAIAHNTKYPEAAIRMANLFFMDNACILFWLGPIYSADAEAEYLVDGWEPIENIFNDGAWTMNTPDGSAPWTYINEKVGVYRGGPVGFGYDNVKYGEILGHQGTLSAMEEHWRSSFRANAAPYERLTLPTLFLAPEALERANELITPIKDYITTMEAKFIMGNESIDKIDAFRAELKALGIEEYLQIQQDAYDAFLANAQ